MSLNNSNNNSIINTINNNDNTTNSLVVIVLDISPYGWGEHELKRNVQDKNRFKSNKRSIGPATLNELINSIIIYTNTIISCIDKRYSCVLIIGVADNETAIIYPRKNNINNNILNSSQLDNNNNYNSIDTKYIKEHIILGINELIIRACNKINTNDVDMTKNYNNNINKYASMASGFSLALCIINRFLVTAKAGGISALRNEHYMERNDNDGVIALMDNNKNTSNKTSSSSITNNIQQQQKRISTWDPRILLIQTSDDRSCDYNAFMNCSFAAAKHNIIVDGCYLASSSTSSSSSKGASPSSSFLEQTVDITGGIFLAPSGAAQVGGALTEILLTVFLPPIYNCRKYLNLPALNKVDFRPRCFDTGGTGSNGNNNIVDMAYVCNQCLSIFRNKPIDYCPTCQAKILNIKRKREI